MIYHKGHKEHKADLPNTLNHRTLNSLDFGTARGTFVLFVLFVVKYQASLGGAKRNLSPFMIPLLLHTIHIRTFCNSKCPHICHARASGHPDRGFIRTGRPSGFPLARE
jgi:hypothetical protein